MLGTVRLSLNVALGIIRRRGLAGFLRKVPPLATLLGVVFPRKIAFAPGDEIAADLDTPDGGLLDRETGLLEGWVLARHERIDRVEILVEGKSMGDARIAIPHSTVCAGRPDAAVCGFRFFLPAGAMLQERDSIGLSFVAHDLSGRAYPFGMRQMSLTPRTADRPPAHHPRLPLAGRRASRGPGKIRIACFTHDLEYGGAQLFLAEFFAGPRANGAWNSACFPRWMGRFAMIFRRSA